MEESLLNELSRLQTYDKFKVETMDKLEDLIKILSIGEPETYHADTELS